MSKSTVGLLGGGQLAMMLAQAAVPLGIKTLCIESQHASPASHYTDVWVAETLDEALIDKLINTCDVITLENENVASAIASQIESVGKLAPGTTALNTSADRLVEKEFINAQGIATAPFVAISHAQDLAKAADELGFPFLVKTRRFGYDGKGQSKISNNEQLATFIRDYDGSPSVAEGLVDFDCEVSLIAARNPQGECVYYPLVQNEHREGILRVSHAPHDNTLLSDKAQALMQTLLKALAYVGVLTIEFFVCGETLVINEIAPRVHNSGHWTIEGAHTSQFENHLRAVCGLPLGSAKAKGYSAMINCIGTLPSPSVVADEPLAHLHDYHKSARPNRKVGHITVNGEDKGQVDEVTKRLRALV